MGAMDEIKSIFGLAADPAASAPSPEAGVSNKQELLSCQNHDGTLKSSFEYAANAIEGNKNPSPLSAYGAAAGGYASYDACVKEVVQRMNNPKP